MSETSKEINISGVTIVLSQNVNEVKNLAEHGYTPVECSFGSDSVVDDLVMEHHGAKYSHKPGVSVNAMENYYGARKDRPTFVVNHIDADNMFACLALAELIPNTPEMRDFAKTIAIMDMDPIGRDVTKMPEGARLAVFEADYLQGEINTENARKAAQGLLEICKLPADDPRLLEATKKEQARIDAAKDDMKNGGQKMGAVYTINEAKSWGFDVWYERQEDKGSSTSAKGWKNPIVVMSSEGSITFGAPNDAVAKEVLGSKTVKDENGEKREISGLSLVFEKLNKVYGCPPESGFGGRASIGGSPRGQKMTEEDLKKCAMVINEMIVAHHSEKAKATSSQQRINNSGR
jgi:hypothetical protein